MSAGEQLVSIRRLARQLGMPEEDLRRRLGAAPVVRFGTTLEAELRGSNLVVVRRPAEGTPSASGSSGA
jgi:hypothetical protein